MKAERAGMATWKDLKQSRVLVVGGAGAFGAGITQALRARGARVIGLDRTGGPNILQADITNEEAVRDAVLSRLYQNAYPCACRCGRPLAGWTGA